MGRVTCTAACSITLCGNAGLTRRSESPFPTNAFDCRWELSHCSLTNSTGGGIASQDFMVVRIEIHFGTTKFPYNWTLESCAGDPCRYIEISRIGSVRDGRCTLHYSD